MATGGAPREPADALAGRRRGRAPAPRDVHFGRPFGTLATPVLGPATLAGEPRPGPVIVEECDSTIVVPPDAGAWRDDHGNVVIEPMTDDRAR